MMDTLAHISQLQKALDPNAPIDVAEKWWSSVLSIEASLANDSRLSKHERELLQQLRRGVSSLIADIRGGFPSPSASTANVALSALQNSIERRTTGPDGWPMRR